MSPPTDSQGRCPSHPFVQLQRLSPRTNEWKALLDSCPICSLDNKSTCSSAASSVCSALNNLNGEEDEKVVGSVGDGLVNELIVKQSSQSRGRRSESQSSHRSRGRSQPRTTSSSSSLDEIKPRRSRSNSRVRFCPPTTQGDGSNLSTSLALLNNNSNIRGSGTSGFVKQSSSSSMPALGNGTASALLVNGSTTVPGLDTSSTCGSISSALSSSALSSSILSSSSTTSQPLSSSSTTSTQPITKSLLNKDPKYKVCPTTMQRQLDESIKITTMSMDISIDEDSWNGSKSSSSTLNLTYERGESGGDGEHQVEEDDGDEDGRGEESHEIEEDEDNRRSPTRQRFKDEEEEARDCDDEVDEQANNAKYQEEEEEEEQKEEEGIMLCMPVANAQQLEPNQDEPTRQEHQEEEQDEDDEIEIGMRRLRESVERHSRRRYRSREPITSRSSRSSSLAPPRGHTTDDDENDSRRRRGHSTSSSSSRRQRSSSCQIIGSRYTQATTQIVQRPDPEEFPCQDYSSQASTQDRRNGGTMLLVKQPSWPPPQDSDLKSLEPEEEKHDHAHQRRQRRSRSSSNARHTARSSSFTYGGNGQVPPPPPPPPPPLKTNSPPQRQNSAPPASSSSAIVLSQSSPTHKPKIGHNHVNMIVNPRQDDDTISTLSFMGNKASSIIPQRQFLRDPQGGGQQLQDVNELPLPMKTSDGTVISAHPSICEEDMKQPSSVNVNTNNYDKRGRCVVHPHIRLRKKKLLNRLCLGSSNKDNPDGGGWKILMSACPDCCVDELRRIRLVEENNKRLALVATQQQQMCQSVATNEMSLVPLDTSERSHQSVTDHQQQAATSSGRGVATLDMLLDGNNSQQQQQHRGSMSRGRRGSARSLHSAGSNDTPSSNRQGSMIRSSSVSARALGGGAQHPSPPKRSPSQDSFRQRRSSSLRSPSQTPPKRSPSQDSFRAPRSSSLVPVSKHIGKSIKKKLNRRPSEETASLTGSSGGSSNEKPNPTVATSSKSSPLDTSDRTGTTHDSTLASTSSPLSQQQFVEHSPADRRSSYGSSHQGSHQNHQEEEGEDGVTPLKKKRRSKRDKSRSSKHRSSSSVSSSQQDSVGSKSVSSSNPPTPGQRGTINVRQMQWTNPKNNQSGTYTGQVNHLFIPHGHGVMTYADQTLGVKDGEWKNGRYRRSNRDGGDGSSRRGSTSSRKSGSSRASSSHTHKSKKSDRKERRSRSRSRSHRHAAAHQQTQVETQ